jgi:hypothetical protein
MHTVAKRHDNAVASFFAGARLILRTLEFFIRVSERDTSTFAAHTPCEAVV